jgi:hypothetical protein
MTYSVYKPTGANGLNPIPVPDNAIDTALYDSANKLGVQLIGRNAIDYGTAVAQNTVQMVSNFSGTIRPSDVIALQGQLWFNATSSSGGVLYLRETSNVSGGAANWGQVINADAVTNNTRLPGSLTMSNSSFFTGDFTNPSNRPMFQSNVINGRTFMQVVPNGTSDNSGITFENVFPETNSGFLFTGINSVRGAIFTDKRGAGVGIPLVLGANGILGINIDIAGGVDILTSLTVQTKHVPVVNPVTPVDGDTQVIGSVISIYAAGAWRQVFPAVYS